MHRERPPGEKPPRERPPRERPPRERPTIGWREWVSLPDLDMPEIKVKVDTGARTSALHAFDIELERRGERRMVTFKVHPHQRDAKRTVSAEAELVEQRMVKNTSGKPSLRPVIKTTVELMDERWEIELTLVARDEMGFRMLLGREAVRGRFVVDPGRSFCSKKPGVQQRTKRSGKEVAQRRSGPRKKREIAE